MNMDSGKKIMMCGTVILALLAGGCDVIKSDVEPEITVKQVDAYALKGGTLGIDLLSAFPDHSYLGVSENVSSRASLDSDFSSPLLVYKPGGQEEEDFQLELMDATGETVYANVRLKEPAAADCGAKNFRLATIRKNTSFTINFLLNEDFCGAEGVKLENLMVYVALKGGTPRTDKNGVAYDNRAPLRGFHKGNGKIEDTFALLTFVPDSDFTGSFEFDYTVIVNWRGDASLSIVEIAEDPDLLSQAEFYSQHTAIVHVTDGPTKNGE